MRFKTENRRLVWKTYHGVLMLIRPLEPDICFPCALSFRRKHFFRVAK